LKFSSLSLFLELARTNPLGILRDW